LEHQKYLIDISIYKTENYRRSSLVGTILTSIFLILFIITVLMNATFKLCLFNLLMSICCGIISLIIFLIYRVKINKLVMKKIMIMSKIRRKEKK